MSLTPKCFLKCMMLFLQDSDEEDEDAENTEAVSVGKISRSPSPAPQEEQSEPEMTEEEKEYQMMMLTKTLLTEILLDVTNEEIYYVAKDVHRKATKGMRVLFLFCFVSSVNILYLHVSRTFKLHSYSPRTITI